MSATGAQAPELRVQHWIGGDGHRLDVPLKLSDIGSGPKICSRSSTGAVVAICMAFPRFKDCIGRWNPEASGLRSSKRFSKARKRTHSKNCASISSSTAYLSPLVTTSRHQVHRSQRSWGIIIPGERLGLW